MASITPEQATSLSSSLSSLSSALGSISPANREAANVAIKNSGISKGINDVSTSLTGETPTTTDTTDTSSKGRIIETPTPVTSITTDGGIKTLNAGVDKLNTISPTTAPGYKAPTEIAPTVTDTSKTDNTGAPTKSIPAPVASFANSAGQEAEFTQEQLNDPKIQNLISTGGYFQTKTTGPTLPSGTDQGTQLQTSLNDTNAQIKTVQDEFNSYNVNNDPAYQTIANNITATYSQLLTAMNTENQSRQAQVDTLGYRSGATQYAGAIQFGIAGAELTAANGRIADLTTKETDAITTARDAYSKGQFTKFNDELTRLDNTRTEKLNELKDYNTNLAKITADFQKNAGQAMQDTAISKVFSSGITDVPGILNALNKAGNTSITAKDVNDALTAFAQNIGGMSTKDLTGNTKDFFELQNAGALPKGVTTLKDFLNYMKTSSTGTGGGTINSGGTIIPKSDIGKGSALLDKNKGPDGFVDPALYQQMYDGWLKENLLPQDFIKYYPPKLYVNPKATTLPKYLMPAKNSSDATAAQIEQLGTALGAK